MYYCHVIKAHKINYNFIEYKQNNLTYLKKRIFYDLFVFHKVNTLQQLLNKTFTT